MPLTLARRQASVNIAVKGTASAPTAITHLSLHSSDPGTNGAGEISGGEPLYVRQAITFADADGDAACVGTNGPWDFPVPATTVRYVGYWTAESGGTFAGAEEVEATVYVIQGTYRVVSAKVQAKDLG